MPGDIHHLQIRVSSETRDRINRLIRKHNRPNADIVRTSLELGLKLLEKLLDAQQEMVEDYIKLLKKDSRLTGNTKNLQG